jgi:Ergosterol biosynthesis ERG4/ERG24 family
MDITTDGLGFMLIVGLLTWLPFVYSLQARYLVFNQLELGPSVTALIFLVNLSGYYIFRVANGEKDQFRKGQNPKSKCSSYFCLACITEPFARLEVFGHEKRFQITYRRVVGLVTSS